LGADVAEEPLELAGAAAGAALVLWAGGGLSWV
jgi:hypothetical protein